MSSFVCFSICENYCTLSAEKIGSFMETATAKPEPEPPDPPEESRCKVIPFERVG